MSKFKSLPPEIPIDDTPARPSPSRRIPPRNVSPLTGLPGMVPASTEHVAMVARKFSIPMLRILCNIAINGENDASRTKAAIEVLNRGLGTPPKASPIDAFKEQKSLEAARNGAPLSIMDKIRQLTLAAQRTPASSVAAGEAMNPGTDEETQEALADETAHIPYDEAEQQLQEFISEPEDKAVTHAVFIPLPKPVLDIVAEPPSTTPPKKKSIEDEI